MDKNEKKCKIGSFVGMWMNPESVIQYEVYQKNNYCILMYIWNLEKWHWLTYFQGRKRDTENMFVDTMGKERAS